MTNTERETRQIMHETILSALQHPSVKIERTFAAREAVPHSKGFILESFNVEGAGELDLPLSAEDASKLRRVCEDVPFRNGLDTTMDTAVRRHCQVDASKVTFPGNRSFLSDTVQSLAVMAVRALGLHDALARLEVHLSKLLVYETGGPVTFHRDTEKEKGIFAEVDIAASYGTGIYRDNLASWLERAKAALEPWLKTATERKRSSSGEKLTIPLQHRYSDKDLSFTVLEGSDKLMADVLKGCRDKNKDECLDLHLCLVTKRKYGELLDPKYDGAAHLTRFHKVVKEDIQFKWIGLNNKIALAFQKLEIDMEKEFVGNGEDPFHSEADEKEYEGPWGEKGLSSTYGKGLPVFELQFHKAMLVAWPKALSIVLACDTGAPSALDHLENTLEIGDRNFCRQLRQFIRYCENNAFKVWGARADDIDSVTPRLINLCKQANALNDVRLTFDLLAKLCCCCEENCKLSYCRNHYVQAKKDESFTIGVRSIEVAEAIAAAIEVFGWESLSASVIYLVKKCAFGQGEAFAEIARQLVIAGNVDAGKQVASTMPEFSWRQPLAIFPDCPEIEKFLRGPRREFVHKPLPDLAAARSFAERYFNTYQEKCAYDGYSARGTPGGVGRKAFCKIFKTDRVFKIALAGRHKDRENLTRLRGVMEKRMSAVSELSALTVTTSPNSSGQPDRKRQRLDTKETPKREKSTAAP